MSFAFAASLAAHRVRAPFLRGFAALVLLAAALGMSLNAAPSHAAEGIEIPRLPRATPVDFATEIRPLLAKNCLACHAGNRREGGLSLETPEAIRAGGDSGPAVSLEQPLESLLLKMVVGRAGDGATSPAGPPAMPPPDNKAGAVPLTMSELGLLRLWIEQGARGSLAAASRSVAWSPLPADLHVIHALALSPDGRHLACNRADRIAIYDLRAGRLAAELIDPELAERRAAQRGLVYSLAFNHDGSLLASGGFRNIKLWRRPPLPSAREMEVPAAVALAASADGAWAALGQADGAVVLLDTASGEVRRRLAGLDSAVERLTFDPEAGRVFAASQSHVAWWNVGDGGLLARFATPDPVRSLAVLTVDGPSQRLATGHESGRIRLWDVAAAQASLAAGETEPPQPKHEWTAHSRAVSALLPWSRNTALLSGSHDNQIRAWQLSGDAAGTELPREQGPLRLSHEAPVAGLALSPDGARLLSAGGKHGRLYDLDAGRTLVSFRGTVEAALANVDAKNQVELARSLAGYRKQDVAESEQRAKRWTDELKKASEAETKAEAARQKAAEEAEKKPDDENVKKNLDKAEETLAVARSQRGRVEQLEAEARETLEANKAAQAAADAELTRRESLAKEAAAAQPASEKSIVAAAILDDGRQAVLADEAGDLQIFDLQTHHPLESRRIGEAGLLTIAALPGARLLSLAAEPGPPQDSQTLAVSELAGQSARWELERTIGTPHAPEVLAGRVTGLAFDPQGQRLASGSGHPARYGELKFWDVASGRLLQDVDAVNSHSGAAGEAGHGDVVHGDTVHRVAFSPDGQFLATACADGAVRVFSAVDGRRLRKLEGHGGHVLDVAWHADSQRLASCSADQSVKLWDAASGEQLQTYSGDFYRIGAFRRPVTSVAFVGTTEQLLCSCGDGTSRLLRTGIPRDLRVYREEGVYQHAAIAPPDGAWVATGGQDGVLRIWNGFTARAEMSFPPPSDEP